MPIVGFYQDALYAGTINTSETFTRQHNFAPPGATVLSTPNLVRVSMNDDDGSASVWISKFTDKDGSHTGSFTAGVFAEGCTSITFKMATTDCVARAVLTTFIWG